MHDVSRTLLMIVAATPDAAASIDRNDDRRSALVDVGAVA
jgi:hypothetical protein